MVVRVGILLTKSLHDRITSLRAEGFAHKTSSFFILLIL